MDHANRFSSQWSRSNIYLLTLILTQIVAAKTTRLEQLIQGLMIAVSSRVWIISLSNIMRHRKRDSIYSEYYDLRRARAVVICNQIRYWFGVFLSLGTISKQLF